MKNLKVTYRMRMLLVLGLVFALTLPVMAFPGAEEALWAVAEENAEAEGSPDLEEQTDIVVGEETEAEPAALSIQLTLEEALEIVLVDSLQMELAELRVDMALFDEDRQRRTARRIDNVYTYDAALAKELVPRAAEMELALSQRALDIQENAILFGTENSYYGLLKAQRDMENSKQALTRAREQLRIAKVSYEAGVVSRGDLVGAQTALASQEAALAGVVSRHLSAMMNLADQLNMPLNTEIKATSSFAYIPVKIDVDAAVRNALLNDIGILGRQEAQALSELRFDIARRYYTPNTYFYKEDNFNLQQSKLNLAEEKKSVESHVRNAWYDLLGAESGYLALNASLAAGRENYRIAQLRYQEGLATRFEVEEAEGRLRDQEKDVAQMLYQYNLAKAQFQYQIFAGGSGF